MTPRLAILLAPMLLAVACASPLHVAGSRSSQTDAVRAALRADAEAGRIRNQRPKSAPLHVAVVEYVAAIDAIDLSDAPPDFAAALRNHRDAWAALIEPLQERAGIRAEMHDAFDRLTSPDDPMHETFRRLIDNVWATWTPVEEATRRAGVEP